MLSIATSPNTAIGYDKRSLCATGPESRPNCTFNHEISWTFLRGDLEQAIDVASAAIEASPEATDPATLVSAGWLAVISFSKGDESLGKSATAHAKVGPEPADPKFASLWLTQMSILSRSNDALAYAERMSVIAQRSGSTRLTVDACAARSNALLGQNPPRHDENFAVAVEGMTQALRCGRLIHARNLACAAALSALRTRRTDAVEWFRYAITLSAELRYWPLARWFHIPLSELLTTLGHESVDDGDPTPAMRLGREMRPEEVIRLALGALRRVRPDTYDYDESPFHLPSFAVDAALSLINR